MSNYNVRIQTAITLELPGEDVTDDELLERAEDNLSVTDVERPNLFIKNQIGEDGLRYVYADPIPVRATTPESAQAQVEKSVRVSRERFIQTEVVEESA